MTAPDYSFMTTARPGVGGIIPRGKAKCEGELKSKQTKKREGKTLTATTEE
jgi:hypothetical protein